MTTGFQWEKYEAWRKHPLLQPKLKHYFPGVGIGVAAFILYVAYDKMTVSKETDSHHH